MLCFYFNIAIEAHLPREGGYWAIQSLLKVLGEANCSSDHLLPHLPFCIRICISLEFAFECSHVLYFCESFHLHLYLILFLCLFSPVFDCICFLSLLKVIGVDVIVG